MKREDRWLSPLKYLGMIYTPEFHFDEALNTIIHTPLTPENTFMGADSEVAALKNAT